MLRRLISRWGKPSLIDYILMIAFTIIQMADGTMTYYGVMRFGVSAEGNPIVAFFIRSIGLIPGLVLIKSVGSLLGVFICLAKKYKFLAFLFIFYITVVIVPWLIVLF